MIKKRNLDPSLIQWIMSQTGLGPGIGELHWVAPVSSATSQFRTQLQRWGVEQNYKIHTLPSLAFAKMVANRNDVMLIMPGSYTETAELAWNKDWTHLVGLGGPNNAGDHSLAGVTIYLSTVQIPETIDITGDRCQFHNAAIGNGGNHATNVGAVNVDGWGNYFKNVMFLGTIADNQNTSADCASLLIDRLGHFPIFEDCIIGQTGWGARSAANSGVLNFVGTSAPAPQNGLFRRCRFLSRSDTATVCMVRAGGNTGNIDREWLYEDCSFYNFALQHTVALSQAFYIGSGVACHDVTLKNCVARGITEWKTVSGNVFVDMPVYDPSGGIATAATAA